MRFFNSDGPFDPLPWAITATAIGIVGCIGFLGWASMREQQEWDAFAASHACRVVERSEGTTSVGVGVGTGVSSSGSVTTVPVTVVSGTPDRAAYSCSDGVVYWRNE